MVSKNELIRNLTKKSQNFDLKEFINKNRFMIFLFSITLSFIILGTLTDNLIPFFFYAIVYLMVVYLNKGIYNSLRNPNRYEIALGISILIFSFLVAPIKHLYFPQTDVYGVFNFVLFLSGLTFVLYPIKEFKKIFPPLLILGILIFINIFGYYYGNRSLYVEWFASLLGNFLNFIGIPTKIQGTLLTIKGLDGTTNFRVVWGCVFMGALFYGTLGSALLINLKTSLKRKIICVIFGVLGAFVVNFFRVVILLSIFYYYPKDVFNYWHEILGQIMFITFVGFYWWFSFKYILKEEKREKETKDEILKLEDKQEILKREESI